MVSNLKTTRQTDLALRPPAVRLVPCSVVRGFANSNPPTRCPSSKDQAASTKAQRNIWETGAKNSVGVVLPAPQESCTTKGPTTLPK